jgi:hypothetical protein
MLTELPMVEQRYLAVREALDSGATITQVAAQYGVDRRTGRRHQRIYIFSSRGVHESLLLGVSCCILRELEPRGGSKLVALPPLIISALKSKIALASPIKRETNQCVDRGVRVLPKKASIGVRRLPDPEEFVDESLTNLAHSLEVDLHLPVVLEPGGKALRLCARDKILATLKE